ncbi:MAG: hypothetical protein AAGJ94_14450 [Pseudomonadota bacterium]
MSQIIKHLLRDDGAGGEPSLQEFYDFIGTHRSDLEATPTLGTLRGKIQGINDPAVQTRLTNTLDSEIDKFQGEGTAMDIRRVILGVVVVALIGVLIYLVQDALTGTDALQQLSEKDKARGLITLIVVVGTVGIALLLVVGIFLTPKDDTRFKERFDVGMQVLTALLAILGTVIGFYYGSTVNDGSSDSNEDNTTMIIEPLHRSMG